MNPDKSVLESKFFRKERRRRQKVRPIIKGIGWLFVLLPLLNIGGTMWLQEMSFEQTIAFYSTYAKVTLALSLITGLGALQLQHWSYYLVQICSLAFVIQAAIAVVESVNLQSTAMLALSLPLVLIPVVMAKQDIKAPFFYNGRRGFRLSPRTPTEVNVMVNDHKFITKDISATGLKIHWPGCEQEEGDEVAISFLLHSKPIHLTGGIARIEQENVSIAFRSNPLEQ